MKSQQLLSILNKAAMDYLLDDGKRKLIKKAKLFYTSLKVECILNQNHKTHKQ